jgi:hypothetical protein
MCATYSLLAGLAFVLLLLSLFVSLFVSVLLAEFSEPALLDEPLVSPLEALVVELVEAVVVDPEDELELVFELAALSFL